MRKKYLSALLFGALLFASAGTFTSCKDYDDEINDLQSQIDKQTDLSSTLSEQIKGLETAAQAAKTAADNALAAAQAASDAAKAAQAAGDAAKAEAEAAKAEAEAAKAAAAKAKAEAIAEAKKMVEELQTKVDEALANKVDASIFEAHVLAVAGQIEGINAQISTIEGNVAGLTEDYKLLDGVVSALDEAVKTLNSSMSKAQEDIKALYATQADIQLQVNSLEEFKKLLEETKLPEINTKLEAIDASIEELNEQLSQVNTEIETINSKLEQLDSDLETLTSTVGDNYSELSNKITELKSELQSELAAEVETISSVLDNVKVEINEIYRSIAEINGNIGTLHTLINKILTGLVLNPTLYVDGIEAVDVASYNYTALLLQDQNLDKDQSNDVPVLSTEVEDKISVVPEAVVSYFMNPINAEVDTDNLNKFSFIHSVAESRSIKNNDLTIDKVEVKDDLLNVYFDLKDADNIENIKEGKADIIALQYTDGDRVVTSDFAALTQTVKKDFAIYKDGESDTPLKLKASDAVVNGAIPTLEVEYTNVEGINLDEYFNVYYNQATTPTLWGNQETINKQGFKLEYELIGYIAKDSDGTNESKHATVTGNVLTIHGVGEEPTGEDRKIIGRTPLLRVKLVDTNSENRIAAVGYIKVVIKDVEKAPIEVADANPVTTDYTVVCGEKTVSLKETAITWLEVENLVLGKLNMSKEEFEQAYKVDVTTNPDGQTEATQYVKTDAGFVEQTHNIGSLVETKDPENHETRVLVWEIKNNQAYQIFASTKKQTSVHTWIKFKSEKPLTHEDVYVKVTWTPETINVSPIATIEDADKKTADWHAVDSREPGFAELHLQVGNATVAGATCEYQKLDCDQTFVNKPKDVVVEDIKATYEDLSKNVYKLVYQFANVQNVTEYVAEDGTEYTITTNGEELKANDVVIASISEKGEILIANNEVAKKVINSCPDKDALDKALNLNVEMIPTTCAPAEGIIQLNNNKFEVKVLKPLFITESKIGDMNLNNASTLTQKLELSFEDFNGYTPKTFAEAAASGESLQSFYKVTSISAVEWTTDFEKSGEFKLVDPKDFEISYTQGTLDLLKGAMGSVTLKQINQSRPNSYQVRGKFKVSYAWGDLFTVVTFTVNAAN